MRPRCGLPGRVSTVANSLSLKYPNVASVPPDTVAITVPAGTSVVRSVDLLTKITVVEVAFVTGVKPRHTWYAVPSGPNVVTGSPPATAPGGTVVPSPTSFHVAPPSRDA